MVKKHNVMIKKILIEKLIKDIQSDIDNALEAADNAHQNATHSESAAETQYDTLGLENAYLAHGQSNRAHELQQALLSYAHLNIQDYEDDKPVGIGSLVELTADSGEVKLIFIGPAAGGRSIENVFIITEASPLAQKLIGNYLEDQIEHNGWQTITRLS